MGKFTMSPELLGLVAERFRSLAEPARLQLLSCLRDGEKTVSELVKETGFGQANISKHLGMLHSHRFVTRRKEGLHVFYSLADESVFELCEIVCGGIQAQVDARLRTLAS